jgi:hypothetical protein
MKFKKKELFQNKMTFAVSDLLIISYILPSNDVKVIGLALTAVGAGTTAIGTLFRRKNG